MRLEIYDQMRALTGKPQDPLKGALPSTLITSWGFYEYDSVAKQYKYDQGVSEPWIKKVVPQYYNAEPHSLFVLDIEHFFFGINHTFGSAASGYRELTKAITIWRENLPKGTPLGYYAMFPYRDYWSYQDPKNQVIWNDCTAVSIKMMKEHLDFVAPSLYTLNNNHSEWMKFAKANIDQAKKFDLPVYCYLWPRYYVPSKEVYAGKLMPYKDFMEQMQFCLDQGCNVILWDNQGVWEGKESQAAIVDLLKTRMNRPVV